MHNDNAIDLSTGEAKKPEIITFYNMTKGAVDVVDEMAATYSTAKKTNRWPMAVFYAMLNVATINSRVLLLSTKEPPAQNRTRRSFLKSLGFNLIEDYQKIRSQQTMLPQSLKAKLVKEEDFQPSAKKAKVTYKRC
ncbi:hypothetical protein AVEN_43627-1, partial [Araneus ventricosus]